MAEFDAAEVLKGSVRDIVAKTGDMSLAEMRSLEKAERAKGADARSTLLQSLQAEITARDLDCPALSLSDASVQRIAHATHEMNAAYCRSMGDDSQPRWDEAPEWQRDSAIAGVRFHLANPLAGPEASHESWMAQKESDGWVFGETKDPEAKTHPCMIPFDELPSEQQAKDTLFRQTVHTLAPVFVELEAACAKLDGPAEREVVGPGSLADEAREKKAPARDVAGTIAALAFCAEGGTECFRRSVTTADFSLNGRKAAFMRDTELRPEKPRVRISEVVALDENGRPVARVKWTAPLEGGGGRRAVFPAGHVAFDL